MYEKNILVCVDESTYAQTASQYGAYLGKLLNLPVKLLNVIEHDHLPKNINLSGSIGLGSRDELLDSLSKEEAQISKSLIAQGRESLSKMKTFVQNQGLQDVSTLQRHGLLDETIEELAGETKVAIIGLRGEQSKESLGKHVEEILRSLHIPILLVNDSFKPINSLLLAYDGSVFAHKALETIIQDPIFPNTKRHIVNVNDDEERSKRLLDEASLLFEKSNIQVQTDSLQGDSVDKLLEYQKQHDLDIIVMGAFSHNRLRSTLFGSFTTKLLNRVKTPVLLFR